MFPQVDSTEHNPSMGGWGYLEDNQHGCFHPGIDFNSGAGGNADCGSPVVAITTQTLVAHVADATGFGLHQWWLLDGGPYGGCYVHYCHLEDATYSEVGTRRNRGEQIATVGRSGGWEHCHLHFEVIRALPPHWRYWPKGQTRDEVAGQYHDPIAVAQAYDWHHAEKEMEKVDVTPELQAISDVIDETGYPVDEVPALIRACQAWGANASSLAAWIEEIGALKARIAELETPEPDAA